MDPFFTVVSLGGHRAPHAPAQSVTDAGGRS